MSRELCLLVGSRVATADSKTVLAQVRSARGLFLPRRLPEPIVIIFCSYPILHAHRLCDACTLCHASICLRLAPLRRPLAIFRAASPPALHACRDSVSATAQHAVRAPHLSSRVIRSARTGTPSRSTIPADIIITTTRSNQLLTMGSDTAPASEQVAAHDQQQEDPVGTHSASIPPLVATTERAVSGPPGRTNVLRRCALPLELCHC